MSWVDASGVVRGASVLTAAHGLEHLDIEVRDGRIASLAPNLRVRDNLPELDARGDIVIPGLVNAHTHAPNNLIKGLWDSVSLERARAARIVASLERTAEDDYIAAAIGAIEMLRTGTTGCYDLFAPESQSDEAVDAVAQAYADVGLRVTLAPLVADDTFSRSIPGLDALVPPHFWDILTRAPHDAATLLGLTERAIRRWHGTASGRIRIAAAPAIPGECTPELLRGCSRLVRDHGTSLHTHLAETEIQARAARRRWGKSIVTYLSELGCLGPAFVGAHAVWLEPGDVARLAESGAAVAHCPASNLKLGSGIARVRELLDAGVVVGLATDGSATSDNQNMFEAMRLAALVGKVRSADRPERWIGSREALTMATTASAAVLGIGHDAGAIEVGRVADLCILSGRSPFLRPLNDAVNALVYCETGADVSTVTVAGRVVLREGRITAVDEEALFARAQEIAERIRDRGDHAVADEVWPYVRRASDQLRAEDVGMPEWPTS